MAGATLLVLLIACVNVAGLLLARGVARRRELAVRGALGAGRGRIVRQLLTESVLLGVAGGVLGLATAAVVLRAVPALVPGAVTRLDEIGLDGVVLAFTLGLSVVVGLLFGAVPALQWSGRRLLRTLVEGSAQATGGFGLRVLVVNESFAREVLGGVPAVGRRVRFAGAGSIYSGGDDVPWEIIGIVADVMYDALSATGTEAEAYAPVRQIDAAPTFEHGFPWSS